MQLSPLHLSVASLLSGRLFNIPDYQRAYSWQSRQRSDLFKDIREARISGREHFMSTVVALARGKKVISADEFQSVDIVDGQQRITTIIILLKAIEKKLNENTSRDDEKVKRDLNDLLVKGDDHSLVLLQTNHDSSNVFTKYLRGGGIESQPATTAAEKNIIDAIIDCENFVDAWVSQYTLIELVGTIRNKLSVIYHQIDDEATVYRVFEVLNSRGLDVKWIDKTKSQLMASIFEHVEDGARDNGLREMRSTWRNIYHHLGLEHALGGEALRFAGTLALPSRPNRIVSEETASGELIEKGGQELKTIIHTAEWLSEIVTLLSRLRSDPRRAAVTKILHARFLAVSIMLRKFEKEREYRLLMAWEKVSFRIYGLGGADTRTKVGEYVRLSYDIHSENLSESLILSRIDELGSDYDIGPLLKDQDYWGDCYNGWTEELRYLLFRYDEHLAADSGEKINLSQWKKIWADDPAKSIEHISPQSADTDYTHHLGNLTMLPPGVNSSLKDIPPTEKAEKYLKHGLRGTLAVGGTIIEGKKWGKKQVRDRANSILDFIKEEWGS
ncbi:DUF262 domain-containing protein [Paracoccus sp. IB05]|uniref:DUF262 domain-containing protein n=1 Tax=Paracoccus sp. IB05 TaxID=2779367 RepID=UPI001E652B3B|nr:DUF262 domain-containing protein [Paracoccus sp. IB05]